MRIDPINEWGGDDCKANGDGSERIENRVWRNFAADHTAIVICVRDFGLTISTIKIDTTGLAVVPGYFRRGNVDFALRRV